ncbi:MAG: hypothetical protein EXS10_00060 [Phycisphaerales bacterium]|nr:hypothetical protein [Phycisphaerales bacterium]
MSVDRASCEGFSTDSARWSRVTLLLVVLTIGAATWFMALPLWQAGSIAEAEATRLAGRIAARERLEQELERTTDAFAELQRERGNALRRIPQDPAQAQLMRALSEPVNGVGLISQTVAAGKSVSAAREGPKSWRAVPVTVSMKSDFATCMRVLHRAEHSDRLVRTLELDLRRDASDATGILDVSLVVDAIWNDSSLEKSLDTAGATR